MENVTLAAAGTDYITVKWNLKYTPISIEHFTQCYLVCDVKTYYRRQSSIPAETNSLTIGDLKPGSICEMHLLAVFNFALLDSGMEQVFWTNSSSKYMCNGLNISNKQISIHIKVS